MTGIFDPILNVVWNSEIERQLCTLVDSISYDVRKRIGTVKMPRTCCTDMSGAIDLFERIDPKVERIETYAGGRRDTFHIRPHPATSGRAIAGWRWTGGRRETAPAANFRIFALAARAPGRAGSRCPVTARS